MRLACMTASLLALTALPVFAQNSPNPDDTGSVTVYVPDFSQSQPIPEIGDLGAFASSLIRLELLTDLPPLNLE
jgi:hypothetical protein